ncbi:MAG: 30S ribosomal protein S27ae [Nanoarchaeota archaeon]|nr:30S ribosomal protein S27ae [Nanoarchaeota archaeon]MBU4116576.1 30S ribosomal protein S27ae [Nanoarchaeota archaeon]
MAKKKTVKKGKKPHKNKPTSKKYTKYKIEGDKITRAKTCPRCGPGIFLMDSQGRTYCGKCHYSEFESKKSEEVKIE